MGVLISAYYGLKPLFGEIAIRQNCNMPHLLKGGRYGQR
jgi:hypothetical protein